jgi:hypothetical protein
MAGKLKDISAGALYHVMCWAIRGSRSSKSWGKSYTKDPSVLNRGLGKRAEELANKPELRGVVETLYNKFEAGKAAQKIDNRVCLTLIPLTY